MVLLVNRSNFVPSFSGAAVCSANTMINRKGWRSKTWRGQSEALLALHIFGPSTDPVHSGWDRLKFLGVVAFQYHPDHSDPLWDERMIFFFPPSCSFTFFCASWQAHFGLLYLALLMWVDATYMVYFWPGDIFFKGSRYSKFHDREIHLNQDFKDQIKTKMGPD